jgi:hypothetical protein
MKRGGMTLVLVGLLLQGIGAQAANLDKDACARLEEEQTRFEKAGVRATIAKGAAWAKDNLPLDKLQEVRRLIGWTSRSCSAARASRWCCCRRR